MLKDVVYITQLQEYNCNVEKTLYENSTRQLSGNTLYQSNAEVFYE